MVANIGAIQLLGVKFIENACIWPPMDRCRERPIQIAQSARKETNT